MSQISERFLSDWKGAQSILKLHRKYQIIVICAMGFMTYLSLGGLVTNNIIFAGLGLLSAGVNGMLCVSMSDVVISRSRKEKRLKIEENGKKFIRNTLVEDGKKINDEILEDFKEKYISISNNIPEEIQSKNYEVFNESWKERIRQLEQDRNVQQDINNDTSTKLKASHDDYNTLYRFMGRKNQEIFGIKMTLRKVERTVEDINSKNAENDKLVGDKAMTQTNTDLSKSIKKNDKIEFLDE